MSRNGSGTYSLPAGNPVVSGTTITTTWANTTLNDIASSLTGSVASDGQTPMTGALNMGSNKVISVTDPTNAQDAATKNYTDTAITTATSGLSATYLTKANNLSDVANASTSRTNLGLGTIATQAASSVAITGGSITGTSLNANDLSSGTIGFARLPTGSVLQVIQSIYSTATTFAVDSYATTGIAASITPKFSTSKILVIISVPLMVTTSGGYGAGLAIYRGGSAVYTDTNSYDEGYSSTNPSTSNNAFRFGRGNLQYLDSPATTSSTTYTVYCSAYTGTITTCQNSAKAMITLLEVAA